MFDEESPSQVEGHTPSLDADNRARDQLLAATTRQRQLELMNLKHVKLDFDGTDPELGTQLLSVFWNRQHYSGSFVYRPVFMRDMAGNGPYFSKFLLNGLLFSASKYLPAAKCPSDANESEAAVLDKVQSIYQGRPARLREIDNRVPIKFLDEYEELEPFHTLTYSLNPKQLDHPTYNVSTFEQLCKLGIIMDRILCNLYAERSLSKDAMELLQTAQVLYNELKDWRDALPSHLVVQLDNSASSTVLPHSLSLHSMYNSLVILLHRPFVSDGHLQSVSTSAASDAFGICAAAAWEIHGILQLYQKSFCMMTAPYFVSYATYVSATIHVRIAAQRGADSEAHKCLQNCLDVLAQHQIKCHAPRRTTRILKGLMHRLNVNLRNVPSVNSSHQPGVETPETSNTVNHVDIHDHLHSNEASHEDFQVSIDPILTNLDIDEIMRSFDYEVRSPGQSVAVGDSAKQFMLTPADEFNPQFGEFNMVSDSLLFLDPLFGIDGSHDEAQQNG
ncbi:hypothetical protein QQX98_008188 [Neonectria punicea]|uniref:Transcription factor domain-containing protein n=1 Tax=Neonectria punicea TaxID=979145 RepID=A0ABR1GVN7_9HYPO